MKLSFLLALLPFDVKREGFGYHTGRQLQRRWVEEMSHLLNSCLLLLRYSHVEQLFKFSSKLREERSIHSSFWETAPSLVEAGFFCNSCSLPISKASRACPSATLNSSVLINKAKFQFWIQGSVHSKAHSGVVERWYGNA